MKTMWIKLNIDGAEIFTPFSRQGYERGFNKVVVKNEKEVYIERKCSFDIRLGIYGSYEEANKICNDIIRAVQEGKEEFEMPYKITYTKKAKKMMEEEKLKRMIDELLGENKYE